MEPLFTPQDLRARLDPLLALLGRQGAGPLAIAVSGGGDSMALLLLTHAAYPGRITALTVDHGLRPESAAEARQVADWAIALGVPHRILRWTGVKPGSGIQAAARRARYRLLAEACAEIFLPRLRGRWPAGPEGGRDTPPALLCRTSPASGGGNALAAPLLVAHTLEDQAETFLLRLAHGSDLGGLGAMRSLSEIASMPPVPLLRPLLDVSRESLRDVLRARAQSWIEDPSNDNQAFERIRLRRLMPALAQTGLTASALGQTTRLMARIDDRLLASADTETICRFATEGYAMLDAVAFGALPTVIALRLLSRVLRIVGGAAYPAGREALDHLHQVLIGAARAGATLAGCQLARSGSQWFVMRELRAVRREPEGELGGGTTCLWDNRFWVRLPTGYPMVKLRPLGVHEPMPAVSGRLGRRLKGLISAGLPALWAGEACHGSPDIAPTVEAFGRTIERPVALFIGAARIDGELCRLWRRVRESTISKECVIPTVS